ncbi:hypothetical protein Pint_15001 [Pistacia integerrima]|uniref:Uncharacterized protein n=1 Tax=Pistacia integerrima TaxID=434235 RepID=A0ACC0ZE85_9ROSI|nr:hypothetical protein Pint_15001 [Pistacia integerrima]
MLCRLSNAGVWFVNLTAQIKCRKPNSNMSSSRARTRLDSTGELLELESRPGELLELESNPLSFASLSCHQISCSLIDLVDLPASEIKNGGEEMLIDRPDQEPVIPDGFNSNYLKVYYGCDDSYFGQKEFSLTLDNDIYLIFQSFNGASELENAIKENHILWVYNGRHSVHCLVCDGKARRSYTDVLREFFEEKLLSSLQIFSSEERYGKILSTIPDESVTSDLQGKWLENRRSPNDINFGLFLGGSN